MMWIKASASGNSGDCVEMRTVDQPVNGEPAILVRDSKDPQGTILVFNRREIAAWIDGAKKGEFDHLLKVDDDKWYDMRTPAERDADASAAFHDILSGVSDD